MSPLIILVIVALLAFIAPLVCERIGIPIVVGEIVFGIAVGLAFFLYNRFASDSPLEFGEALSFLSLIGLLFLMFLAGMEINLNVLLTRGPWLLISASLFYGLVLAASYIFMLFIGLKENAFFIGLAISAVSVGVVIPTMREWGKSQTDSGQTILVSAIMADFLAMIILMLYAMRHSFPSGGSNVITLPAMFLLFLISLFIAIFLLGKSAVWHFPNFLSRFFRVDDSTEIGVRSSLAILFIFVAVSGMLSEEASKSIAILGAFLAGVVITLIFPQKKILEKQLYGIGYGFFIPFFFIHLGITLDFGGLIGAGSLLLMIPLLLAASYGAKALSSLTFAHHFGARTALSMGLLLSANLSLLIAASEVGFELGILDEAMKSTLVLVGVLTSLVSPIIFRRMIPKEVT